MRIVYIKNNSLEITDFYGHTVTLRVPCEKIYFADHSKIIYMYKKILYIKNPTDVDVGSVLLSNFESVLAATDECVLYTSKERSGVSLLTLENKKTIYLPWDLTSCKGLKVIK